MNRRSRRPAAPPDPIVPSAGADGTDPRFARLVKHLARVNLDRCWHCWCCGGGCPFSDHMDLMPNQVIRLVQFGRRREALACRTIWVCVGCHTCSSRCPNRIDIAAVMDALRQLAIRDGEAVPEKDIHRFHKHIHGSIQRNGRLNKLDALMRFKIGSGKVFSDVDAGARMLLRGKLEVKPRRVADRAAVHRIFDHYERRRGSFESHE